MIPAPVPPVAVDTNILFSALLRPDNSFIRTLFAGNRFYVSESVLTELFHHKGKIVTASQVSEEYLPRAYHKLISSLHLYKEELIPPTCWNQAYDLCREVDVKDTVHVALALALDGLLWTGDKVLRTGLLERGFDRFFTP